AWLIRRLVLLHFGHRFQFSETGSLVAAVADQRNAALPRGQRHGRRQQMRNERRPAHHVVVGKSWLYAQVFRRRKRRQIMVGRPDEQAVDIRQRQPCLAERAGGGVGPDVPGAYAGARSGRAQACPHNSGGTAQRIGSVHCTASVAGSNTTNHAESALSGADTMRARTRIPIRTAPGASPSTRLIMRGPSSRSTSTTL